MKGTRQRLTGGSGTVAVVGTTPDYISKLHQQHPREILFFADSRFKGHPLLEDIPSPALLFADQANFNLVYENAAAYLSNRSLSLEGIACFDCESLLLASHLASLLGLQFPSSRSIALARNKFESKQIWFSKGVSSPSAILARELKETLNFFQIHQRSVVLKPISGSGSELLFHCKSEKAVNEAVALMMEELPRRRRNPLFQPFSNTFDDRCVDPCGVWVVEEFIPGPEFSCDFILQGGMVQLIRETGKVRATDYPFGSVLAYTFPPRYPEGFRKEILEQTLAEAVGALGFDWGYFMADYILKDGSPVILEVTPRPGGDSIPDLVKAAAGHDVIETYLDFVRGKLPSLDKEPPLAPEAYASINLFAREEGTVVNIDGSEIASLPCVNCLILRKSVGDGIVLPPKDYDNRLLGYCIVALEPSADIRSEALGLESRLRVSIR
jgi:biotin carboxylase